MFTPEPPQPPPRAYDFPSYDALRYPDMRPRVGLTPLSPGMLDFRMQRFIHDTAPPAPDPAPNRLGNALQNLFGQQSGAGQGMTGLLTSQIG